MKIALDSGSYLEPDEEPRDTRFHMRIVRVEPVPNFPLRHQVTLECGHGGLTIGNLAHAGGVAFCTKCRDLSEEG